MDEKDRIKQELKESLRRIKKCKNFSILIPEVGTNIAYALKNANKIDDVVGVPGRIRNAMGKPCFLDPEFGASSHMACTVISVMGFDKEKRCAMNIKYDEKILGICKKLGLKISSFDRRKEPEEFKKKEGYTLPWGVEQAMKKIGTVPDIIYDLGDWGKEAMIRIIGKKPKEVLDILLRIAEDLT